MDHLNLLEDWAIVMAISAAALLFCHKLKLPVVLGYMLAGVIIGPHTPPHLLVTDEAHIDLFTDLGIILLLFHVGLEFSLKKVFRLGVRVLTATVLKTVFMTGLGYGLGRVLGWSDMDSVFLGAILSISSTAIVAKALLEAGRTKEHSGQVMLGILVVEDFIAVLMLAVLSGITGSMAPSLRALEVSVLEGAGFITLFLLVGILVVPKLLRFVARFRMNEILIIAVLGLVFSAAALTVKFGFSVALGAFVMGAVISETEEAHQIIRITEPIRDMFIAMFFVAVGLMIDPAMILRYFWPILLVAVLVIPAKFGTCLLSCRLAGYDPRTSLAAGLGLAQIGEFSFILAQLGEDKQVTSPFLYAVAVTVAVLTTVTTPILIKRIPAPADASTTP